MLKDDLKDPKCKCSLGLSQIDLRKRPCKYSVCYYAKISEKMLRAVNMEMRTLRLGESCISDARYRDEARPQMEYIIY